MLGRYISRFGVEAVMGRPLGYGEIKRILVSENVYYGYLAREKALQTDIVKWQKENRDLAELLSYAEKLNGQCS
jgi:uncharacterized protein involved in exopolysaccharide biosynthesis